MEGRTTVVATLAGGERVGTAGTKERDGGRETDTAETELVGETERRLELCAPRERAVSRPLAAAWYRRVGGRTRTGLVARRACTIDASDSGAGGAAGALPFLPTRTGERAQLGRCSRPNGVQCVSKPNQPSQMIRDI